MAKRQRHAKPQPDSSGYKRAEGTRSKMNKLQKFEDVISLEDEFPANRDMISLNPDSEFRKRRKLGEDGMPLFLQ